MGEGSLVNGSSSSTAVTIVAVQWAGKRYDEASNNAPLRIKLLANLSVYKFACVSLDSRVDKMIT